MAIIKQYHKDTDTTYVYESVSYWDEEKKQSRSKRHVIGKIDPETGEIVPTGKRGRRPKETGRHEENSSALVRLYEESLLRIKDLTILADQKDREIASLQKELRKMKDAFRKLEKHLSQCRDICSEQADQI